MFLGLVVLLSRRLDGCLTGGGWRRRIEILRAIRGWRSGYHNRLLRLLDFFQELLNVIVIAIGKLPSRAYRVLIDGTEPLELQPSRTFQLDWPPRD